MIINCKVVNLFWNVKFRKSWTIGIGQRNNLCEFAKFFNTLLNYNSNYGRFDTAWIFHHVFCNRHGERFRIFPIFVLDIANKIDPSPSYKVLLAYGNLLSLQLPNLNQIYQFYMIFVTMIHPRFILPHFVEISKSSRVLSRQLFSSTLLPSSVINQSCFLGIYYREYLLP